MEKQKNVDMKKLAIKYYKSNKVSQKKVADLFEINERTFRNWLQQDKKNVLERKQRNAKSYKIKKKHVDYVLKLLKY